MAKQSSTSSKHGHRRWTTKAKARVLLYAEKHGHGATMKKYRISSSQIHIWKQQLSSVDPLEDTVRSTRKGIDRTQIILAKKLRSSILERVKTTDDIGEIELTALLLINNIMRR